MSIPAIKIGLIGAGRIGRLHAEHLTSRVRSADLVMVADAVEGASRTLAEPTPKRIETLVHEIALKRLLDGQFDECSLTLGELAIVEDSLTKSLIGIHHGRIKYPEQKTA